MAIGDLEKIIRLQSQADAINAQIKEMLAENIKKLSADILMAYYKPIPKNKFEIFTRYMIQLPKPIAYIYFEPNTGDLFQRTGYILEPNTVMVTPTDMNRFGGLVELAKIILPRLNPDITEQEEKIIKFIETRPNRLAIVYDLYIHLESSDGDQVYGIIDSLERKKLVDVRNRENPSRMEVTLTDRGVDRDPYTEL